MTTLIALDVHYFSDESVRAAGVAFSGWEAEAPSARWVVPGEQAAAYVPGNFADRELPYLLDVLARAPFPPDLVLVDGNAWNAPGVPGLGARLFHELGGSTPVVGVAKKQLRGVEAETVLRGRSKNSLFVTAAGLDAGSAARRVASMAGPHRIPTMLKLADQLARGTVS